MNSKRKIQAFTLGELLVVLVISSIVVTLAFLTLSNVQRQVKSINDTFETQQKVIKLERLLMLDLNTRNASYDSQKKRIVLTRGKDTVSYQFAESTIIREKDTIALSPAKMLFYLDGELVSSGDIDAIECSFSDLYAQKGFFVFKKKDASHYINK